jgi:hypothetical protein
MVRCTSESPPPPLLSVRALPMLSTSSMKMMDGACSLQHATQFSRRRTPGPSATSCSAQFPVSHERAVQRDFVVLAEAH